MGRSYRQQFAPMSDLSRHLVRRLLPLMFAALATGCSTLNTASSRIASVVTPYQAEVVQGNFVSREQVQLLRPGMTRAQVRELLGTPLLTSLFHQDRWDYVFTLRRKDEVVVSRKLTVFFKADVLDRHEGDEMPTEAEFVASLQGARKASVVPVLELTPEQRAALALPGTPLVPAPEVQAPSSLPVSYPPLEPPSK